MSLINSVNPSLLLNTSPYAPLGSIKCPHTKPHRRESAASRHPDIAFVRGPERRWRRHRQGQCIRCGCNLEGNVSGVCPECGEAT